MLSKLQMAKATAAGMLAGILALAVFVILPGLWYSSGYAKGYKAGLRHAQEMAPAHQEGK